MVKPDAEVAWKMLGTTVTTADYIAIDEIARAEHSGKISPTIRALIKEALEARRKIVRKLSEP